MVPTLAECASSRLPRVEATYELPDMFVVVYDYVDGVTLDHYVCERDDDNGDGVYGSDVAISLILRDEKGNFVFWRSEYVRKPAKGESRAFSIQIYGLPKYASYEAYAYASQMFLLWKRYICLVAESYLRSMRCLKHENPSINVAMTAFVLEGSHSVPL